jgi:putative ABC transport system permease protein
MKLRNLVTKEMFQRRNQLFSSLLAITLGIAIIIGIKNITVFSEKAVHGELEALGANILILPKSATVQDYYSADFNGGEIPEDYIHVLVNSDIKGIDNLSPKLSMDIEIKGKKAILTGILPRNEFKSKALWRGALGIFSKPEDCVAVCNIPGIIDSSKNIKRNRVIDDLAEDVVLAGSDIAGILAIEQGDSIKIKGKSFFVEAILPITGTVDDSRIYTHLRTVQKFSNKKSALNVIEIMGCCAAISEGLIKKINQLLPNAKVVTITQIIQTKIKTNRLMNKLSMVTLIIILIIGGASMANYMYANVYERRREIGIMSAMGAKPAWIVKVFIMKSIIIGFVGGIIGYVLGTVMALFLGPKLAGLPVLPMPVLALYALIISLVISVAASILPAIKATKVDPFIIIQED